MPSWFKRIALLLIFLTACTITSRGPATLTPAIPPDPSLTLSPTPFFAPIPATSNWSLYTDPSRRFTINYPADWTHDGEVKPEIGQVLTFQNQPSGGDRLYKVQVGVFNKKINEADTLAGWLDQYNHQEANILEDQVKEYRHTDTIVDGLEALSVVEVSPSPVIDSQYTAIRHADRVWYVWSTIASGADPQTQGIYPHMLNSLKFTP